MDKEKEVEIVKKLEESMKILGMDQCALVFSRAGKDSACGIMICGANPITLLGYSKYLEHAGNSQMGQQFLKAQVDEALKGIKEDIEKIAKDADPTNDKVIH